MQPPDPPGTGNRAHQTNSEFRQSPGAHFDLASFHRVMLVGASIRAAAQSAKNAGFRVTGADLFGDMDTREACERYATWGELESLSPSDFADWVNRCEDCECVQVGGVTARNAKILDRIFESRRLRQRPNSTSHQVLSPDFLRNVAEECRVTFPASHFPHELAVRECATGATSRWLRKAAHSSGGLGVRWADTATDTDSNSELWQRWIAGRSFGVSFFGDGLNACLLGICRSSTHRMGDRPFVYAGSFGPVSFHSSIADKLVLVGQAIARRSQLEGLFGLDVIIDRSETITLLEINPRWTSSMELIERSLLGRGLSLPGKTLMGAMLRKVTAAEMKSAIQTVAKDPSQVRWKRIVYARNSGQFRHTKLSIGRSRLLQPFDHGQWSVQFSDVPKDGQRIAKHEPILSLVLSKSDPMHCPMQQVAASAWHEIRRLVRWVQQSIEEQAW